MKNKILTSIFYSLAVILFLTYIYIEIIDIINLEIYIQLILLLFICLSLYIGAYYLSKELKNNKQFKINLYLYFGLYLYLLIIMTLFDSYFGRDGIILIEWNKELLDNYLETSFNIIPFRTLFHFVNNLINGKTPLSWFLINNVGNLLAFIPFSFFLPKIFKKQNKIMIFIITILLIIIFIEGLQFITLSGVCDIDDLILNTTGAIIAYKVLNKKTINQKINKILKIL